MFIASAIQAGLAAAWRSPGGFGHIVAVVPAGDMHGRREPRNLHLAPVVVGEEHATEGNAYLDTARYVGMISGPVLAARSRSGGVAIALLVDAGTFAVVATPRRPSSPVGARGIRGGGRRSRAGSHGAPRPPAVYRFRVIAFIVMFAAMDNVAEVFFAIDTLGVGSWGSGCWHPLGRGHGGRFVADREAVARVRLMPAMAVAAIVGALRSPSRAPSRSWPSPS